MKNEYIPHPAVVESIITESFDTKTYKVRFADKEIAENFSYVQGQFMQVSLMGVGEAPISITSSPSRKGFLEFSIRAAGKLTKKIHELKVGDTMFIRGPYGNGHFPFENIKGKNLIFVAGGIGLPPLRSLINLVMDNRKDFGNIKILYGCKTADEFCFKDELKAWNKTPNTEVLLTVDKATDDWNGRVGVVTELWKDTDIKADNSVAFLCGPPIMIKFVVQKLEGSGFTDDNIVMTLERHMKCGLGKCGHCNVGDKFICIDGPVFTCEEVKKMPRKDGVM